MCVHQGGSRKPVSLAGVLRWAGPYSKRPCWPVDSIVRLVFRHAAGPLMPLAMVLSSSHLNNVAERQVKRPPTRSVPMLRFFGGCRPAVKAHWNAAVWQVTTVQLRQWYLSSCSAKQGFSVGKSCKAVFFTIRSRFTREADTTSAFLLFSAQSACSATLCHMTLSPLDTQDLHRNF